MSSREPAPVPAGSSSSMEPSLGQELSCPLRRTGVEEKVTAIDEVSCDTGLMTVHRPYLAGSPSLCFGTFVSVFPESLTDKALTPCPAQSSSLLQASSLWIVAPVASYRVLQAQEARLVLHGVTAVKSAARPAFSTTP